MLAASVAFIAIITFFPLIGSLTVDNFPLRNVLLDNLHLLVMLCAISIPFGFFLGFIASILERKRIFWMIIIGLIFYWLILLLVILAMSKFSLNGNDFVEILQLSVWAMLAYSMFAVPLVILAVFLLEKWTRK